MLKLISLCLSFLILFIYSYSIDASQSTNPCSDSIYQSLKLKPIDSLSKKEKRTLKELEYRCDEYIASFDKPSHNTVNKDSTQKHHISLNKEKGISSILNSLYPSPNSRLLYWNITYYQELYGNVMRSGKGFTIGVGFNPAWFKNKRLTIAPYMDASISFGGKFTDQFIKDFNEYLNYDPNISDTVLRGAVNSIKEGNFCGTQYFQGFSGKMKFGLLLKTPYRFVPPLKTYIIYYSSYVAAIPTPQMSGNGWTIEGSGGISPVYLPRWGYGFEANIFPGYSIPTENLPKWCCPDQLGGGFLSIGSVSISIDILSFKNAYLKYRAWDTDFYPDDQPIMQLTTEKFRSIYNMEYSLSLNIGVNVM
jgi:hypothetical protein